MNKTSILTLALVAAFAAGSVQAAQTTPAQAASIATQIAKKGADDRQKDDRGGRLSDDSRGEQVAREGGVRGRGRGYRQHSAHSPS